MANFNKAFNFRGGFQVDEDTFLVRGSNVGIGSSVPSERLDVAGIVKARGLIVDSSEIVAITTASVGVLSATEIRAGLFTGTEGVVAQYYGDGSTLSNLPTSQWLDIDVGLGYTSIYSAGNVGVDTNDPRYKFQVGGVPFKTTTGPVLEAQDGVGIEDGDIYVSGIVSARYNPSVTVQGFVGYGSYINTLNATELTTGAIPSNRYGPLIITEEVRALRLTGIASTAIGVTTDAQLSFDTAVANELRAENRFISTEGFLQIGIDEDVSGVGDIDVVKDTGDVSVLAVAKNDNAEILVGSERPGGSNRGFGGIRRGTFTSEPLTGATDLDLVNYDTGNLNLYLHSGSGGQGATNGKIRFIYGQRDVSLFEVDKDGHVNLPSNVAVTGPLLSVGGSGYFENGAQLDGDLNVTSGVGSFAGNVIIGGELTVSNIALSGIVTFTGVDTDFLRVGQTEIDASTNVADIAGIMEVNGGSGTVDVTGSLEATSMTSASINATNIIFSTGISGPNGFSVNSDAEIAADKITTFNGATFGGTVGFSSLSGATVVTSAADVGTLNATTVVSETIEVDDITINNSLNISDLSVDNIEATDIQSDDTDFLRMKANQVRTSEINNQGSDVGFTDDVDMQNNDIVGAQKIEAEKLSTTTGRLILNGGVELSIAFQTYDFGGSVGVASALAFEVFPAGASIGVGRTHLQLGG